MKQPTKRCARNIFMQYSCDVLARPKKSRQNGNGNTAPRATFRRTLGSDRGRRLPPQRRSLSETAIQRRSVQSFNGQRALNLRSGCSPHAGESKHPDTHSR
ncbi:unnamed protein product [Ascophyllum nodosum]